MENDKTDIFLPSDELSSRLELNYSWETRVEQLMRERTLVFGRADYDFFHLKAVANWAKILGKLEGLEPKETEILTAAGWLHDIGYDFSGRKDSAENWEAVKLQKKVHSQESARIASEWYQAEESLRTNFSEDDWSAVVALIKEHEDLDKIEQGVYQYKLLPYIVAADTLGQIDTRGGVKLSYKGKELRKYLSKPLSRRMKLMPSSKARAILITLINNVLRNES